MHRILFVDVTCFGPYDGNTLETQPQGGSESTLTRVAQELARRGHRVRVAQHSRTQRGEVNGVEYTSLREADYDPTHVVAFREARILDHTARLWPHAKNCAWYQDFHAPGPEFVEQAERLARYRGTAIPVSDWHEMLWVRDLKATGYGDRVPTKRIYNAIPDDLKPDDTPVDPNKFLFFSSPHKGLKETLDFFARLKDHPQLGDVRLHIANPGYRKADVDLHGDRVVELGPLPWKRVIQELRSAFLVLHYNPSFPETFGIVHAEADAVGTPWIAGFIGANPEVCSNPDELADLSDPDGVIDRILKWRNGGRPKVQGSPWFRLSKVVSDWESFLGR